mgnify:CR=1 FL=1
MKRLIVVMAAASALTLAGCQNDTETVDTDGTVETTNPMPPNDGVTGEMSTGTGTGTGATGTGMGTGTDATGTGAATGTTGQ